MPYVSQLLGTAVESASGERLGRVRNVLASGTGVPVVSAVVADGDRRLEWPLERHGRTLRAGAGVERAPPPGEFSLASLLDRQILDARGMKVVRVNDVRLDEVHGTMRVTGVDVGARGYLRRLGMERIVARVADVLGYALPDAIIPWGYVASLDGESGVRLGIDRDMLRRLRPIEVAELLDALDTPDRNRVLGMIDDPVLADALSEASAGVQEETLAEIGDARAAQVLGIMPPDEAVDVLGALDPRTTDRLLASMQADQRAVLGALLGYHPRTAGGLMTPELVSIPHDARAAEAIDVLRREAPRAESVYYVYAIDDRGALRGVVPLRDLLTAPPDTAVAEIARPARFVHCDESDEDVAERMTHYDLLALPVVDDADVLLGIITVDDVFNTMQARASDDLAAVTGAGERTGQTGRLGGLVASLTGGLIGALVLLRVSAPARPWFLAGAIPLMLRLAQDQGAWAVATHLEEESSPGPRRALVEVAAGGLASLVPAAALAAGATLSVGRGVGLPLGASLVLGSTTAAATGMLLPELLAAAGQEALLRRGRVVPLASSLAGLAVYLVLVGALG